MSAPQQLGSVVPAISAPRCILLDRLLSWPGRSSVGRRRSLKRLDFNRMAEAGRPRRGRWSAPARRLDPVHAVGKLVFWLVMLVVILLASTALGLESINEMFGTDARLHPHPDRAIVIVILGMIVGEFVRGVILASAGTVAGVPTLAKVAKGAVVLVSMFMALQQVGVAGEIVTAAFTLMVGAVALAVGLAFGLGNQRARRRDHPAVVRGGAAPPAGAHPVDGPGAGTARGLGVPSVIARRPPKGPTKQSRSADCFGHFVASQ